MVKVVKPGEEYKVLKQKNLFKKIVLIISIIWITGVLIPSCYFWYKNANSIKKFFVIKGVYEVNKTIVSGYDNLSSHLIKNINISKYTSQIKIPEIKVPNISNKTTKISKGAKLFSAFGVKGANKVVDTTETLNKQIEKINSDIKNETLKIKKTLDEDLDSSIKNTIASFGKNQMQKQLGLNDTNYKNLLAGNYGFLSNIKRYQTSAIYKELQNNKTEIIKGIIKSIDKYFTYIYFFGFILLIIIAFIPIIILFKITKLFSDNFTTCPYCKKVFLSKTGKFNILAKLKFWE